MAASGSNYREIGMAGVSKGQIRVAEKSRIPLKEDFAEHFLKSENAVNATNARPNTYIKDKTGRDDLADLTALAGGLAGDPRSDAARYLQRVYANHQAVQHEKFQKAVNENLNRQILLLTSGNRMGLRTERKAVNDLMDDEKTSIETYIADNTREITARFTPAAPGQPPNEFYENLLRLGLTQPEINHMQAAEQEANVKLGNTLRQNHEENRKKKVDLYNDNLLTAEQCLLAKSILQEQGWENNPTGIKISSLTPAEMLAEAKKIIEEKTVYSLDDKKGKGKTINIHHADGSLFKSVPIKTFLTGIRDKVDYDAIEKYLKLWAIKNPGKDTITFNIDGEPGKYGAYDKNTRKVLFAMMKVAKARFPSIKIKTNYNPTKSGWLDYFLDTDYDKQFEKFQAKLPRGFTAEKKQKEMNRQASELKEQEKYAHSTIQVVNMDKLLSRLGAEIKYVVEELQNPATTDARAQALFKRLSGDSRDPNSPLGLIEQFKDAAIKAQVNIDEILGGNLTPAEIADLKTHLTHQRQSLDQIPALVNNAINIAEEKANAAAAAPPPAGAPVINWDHYKTMLESENLEFATHQAAYANQEVRIHELERSPPGLRMR